MLNLHRALLCTGIDLDDVVQIDCLAYTCKYFVFLSVFIGWLQHLVLCSM